MHRATRSYFKREIENANAAAIEIHNDEKTDVEDQNTANEANVQNDSRTTQIQAVQAPDPSTEQRLASQQLFKQAAPLVDLSQITATNEASDMSTLINYTYYVLKDFSENNLLTEPTDRSEKLAIWKHLVAKHNVNVDQLMNFVIHEATAFKKTMSTPAPIEMRSSDVEMIEDVPEQEEIGALPTTSISSSPPSRKRNRGSSDTRCCRACREYFTIGPENQWLCRKPECQARKCTFCTLERVNYKNNGKCERCHYGKPRVRRREI